MPKAYITEERREILVRETCDVLVAGGGTAGCVAALAAARSGAKTVLIEQLPILSGTFANGGIIALSFHSAYTSPDYPIKKIVKGIPEEIIDKLTKEGGCSGYLPVDPIPDPYRNSYVVIPDHEVYPGVISKMLIEAGVTIYLHTFLVDVVTSENHVDAVIIESKSGREAIIAKNFIDCTGDGDLAYGAGAEYIDMHNRYKHAGNTGMVFGIGCVNVKEFLEFAKESNILVPAFSLADEGSADKGMLSIKIDLYKSEKLHKSAEEANIRGAFMLSMHENTIDYVNGIGKANVDIRNVEEISQAEMELRIKSLKFTNFFRENIPGFKHAFINWTANQLGIRVSRIIKCEYSLTNDEIIYSSRFDDEIGYFGYHDLSPIGPEYVMKNKGYYGLPYRMLLPKGLDNVLVAGRMVSEAYEAQMSTRMTINCMIQGQAAGTAAALSALKGISPRDLDYPTLRVGLLAGGVYLEDPIQ